MQQRNDYELTHPQQRIWYTEQLHPGTAMHSNAGTIKIEGTIDFNLLRKAINIFLRDTPSARIQLSLHEGHPRQHIADYTPYEAELIDFTAKGIHACYEWDSIQTSAPMPLLNRPLYYFALIKLPNQGRVYAKFHHIISDGLSLVEFANKTMAVYEHLLEGQEISMPEKRIYSTFIEEEKNYLISARFEKDRKFWNERFYALPDPSDLKHKRAGYSSIKARRKTNVLPLETSRNIRTFCEKNHISIYAFFLTTLALYINRITGKEDIVIGAPVSNRVGRKGANDFGMLVSTVPVRIQVSDKQPFLEFVKTVAAEWFNILKHQRYPYDLLLSELRKTHKGVDSLFDITLSYQVGKLNKTAERFICEGRWHFNGYQANSLSIHLNDREGSGKFILDYDYHSPFYAPKEIDYVNEHFLNIINNAVRNPHQLLYELNLLSDEEKNRVLCVFNDTKMEYPAEETLIELWYKNYREQPDDAVFAVNDGKNYTYQEIEEVSNAYAQKLIGAGVGRESVVAILTARSIDYPAAVLAVLKAGGAFLPIDPSLPQERITYMLEDSKACALLVGEEYAPMAEDAGIDTFVMDGVCTNACAPEMKSCPEDLAYVIYTSGSTGLPKGVMIENRSIVQFVYSLSRIWTFAPGGRLLAAASFSFDISVMELVLCMAKGAVYVLAKEDEVNIPRNMANLISAQQVNMMVVTPGRMELLLLDAYGPKCIENFREIGLGGDVLPQKLLAQIQQNTKARITNFYGPTEITICCTCADVTQADTANIGKPMHNVKTYIFDKYNNPVSIGVPGELFIGGAGLARGYINKPELTKERFIRNPLNPSEKLYRTGDLVRWFPKGEIEFLGRIDQQVKIRGYRIELGEIENKLQKIPGISNCCVIDRTDHAERKYLCAYLCMTDDVDVADIKKRLLAELPSFMIPSYFVRLEQIPLNASDKVDRRSLPDPLEEQELVLQSVFTPPRTKTERILAEIWSSVLNISQIGREASFFEIGGDSLSVIEVMIRVSQTFNVDIRLEQIYQATQLRDFAALIDMAEKKFHAPIVAIKARKYYPVTSAQQRMWTIQQRNPDSIAYNIPLAFELKALPDDGRIEQALHALAERHESLRTRFVIHRGELKQQILDKVVVKLTVIEAEGKRPAQMLRRLLRPFDLSAAPLLRAVLLTRQKQNPILLFDISHAVCDMQSLRVMMADFAALYAGNETLRPVELGMKDYAVWQHAHLRSAEMEDKRAFWQEALSGELPLLNMFHEKKRPAVATYKGARKKFLIDKGCVSRLQEIAKRHDTTLFVVLLAAYNLFLAKHTGQEDIIVGTPVSGRLRAEISDLVGVFINTLPLRNYPKGEMCFDALVADVAKRTAAAFSNQDYPLERILADLDVEKDLSRNPLFDTMLVMANGGLPLELDGKKAKPYIFDAGVAKLDLTLEIYEGDGGLQCIFEYNTDLFYRRTIQRFVSRFMRLLDTVVLERNKPIKDISILPEAEYHLVTQTFNQTDRAVDYTRSLQSIFEKTAKDWRDKTALIIQGERMSFARLNERANQIAHALRKRGVGANSIVGLLIRRSFDMVAGLLGILKAGGGYLPLDPSYPQERLNFTLTDSSASLLLTQRGLHTSYQGECLYVEDISEAETKGNLLPVEGPEDAGYMIYTSGSTGVPKGAILPRRAMINLYEGCKPTIAYTPDEISICLTTVAFDIFVIDALMPLFFGMSVVLATEEELRRPHLVAKLIEQEKVTFIQTTPTRLRMLMEDKAVQVAAGKSIKKAVAGGEEFPLSLLRLLKKHLKDARIIAGYGPTETTVYCTFKDLTHTSHITIGHAICNTRMYILDAHKQPTPIGVLGEAYISGDCVMTQYYNRPELNEEKMEPDPFWPGRVMYRSGDICTYLENGEMEIRGRTDFQVKIRGQRIELGEIEAAFRKIKGVGDCVVRVWGEGAQKTLCAYYTGGKQDEAAVRETLLKELPNYMVPAFIMHLPAFVLTANGKTDRRALPEPVKEVKPARKRLKMTDNQRKMAGIWKKVLKVREVRLEDDFFALGGDSLCVIMAQAMMLEHGWDIKTQEFYDAKTLQRVVACVESGAKQGCSADAGLEAYRNKPLPGAVVHQPLMGKRVLLSGASGYLGAHILKRLLDEKDIQITCLIRGADEAGARSRFDHVMMHYFEKTFSLERITLLRGDIGERNLGLTQLQYRALLQQKIDTVVHCAAFTDHVGHAETFYKANVLGTEHVLSFVRKAKASLAHISTISVSGTRFADDPKKRCAYDEDCFYIGQNYMENEYAKSKLMAEKLVIDAIAEGAFAHIYRVGVLTGRYADGGFQLHPEKNAFANRIRAMAATGAYPAGIADRLMEMTPVDICADFIIRLAQTGGAPRHVHHLYNPNMLSVKQLAESIEAFGIPLAQVSDAAFKENIYRQSQANALDHIAGLMEGLADIGEQPCITLQCDKTNELLKEIGCSWPGVDQGYLQKFFEHIL
ncbi:MAG: amino acid adenylation domain-containing protein [Christensenellales bacterium]|jgi:amino acid adenylation domain-containing protein/thioester reductase-like protein